MPLTAEVLRRIIPSFSLSMVRVDDACAPEEHYSEYFDEFSHQLFAEVGPALSASTDDPAAFGHLLRHPKPFGTLIHSPPAYLQGATYQHLFKRNGIHHCLDVAIRERARPLGILGMFREAQAPPFTRRDLVEIAELYPFLVHAFAAPPRPPAQLDERAGAMLVCNRAGTIVWASSMAKEWLQSAVFRDERVALGERALLPLACRELMQRLERVQRKGSSGANNDVPTLTLTVPGGRLRLRAYSMVGFGETPEDSAIGIQLTLEMDRRVRILAALDRAELAPQQRRIAYALYAGASAAEICEQLALRRETFKSYRKELYARLGVSGASELRSALEALARDTTLDLTRHLPHAPSARRH